MSLLTIIISTAAIVFIIISLDAIKRGKLNLIHGSIFLVGGLVVWYSLYNPDFLNKIARVFGSWRGSDIIVYAGILVLGFLYLEIINKITKDNFTMSKLVTNEALSHVSATDIMTQLKKLPKTDKSRFMFHIKGLNESATIGKVIDEIVAAGFVKILVVNDGSTDSMPDIVREKMAQYPHTLIVLVNHLINRRHGWANKTAIQFFRTFGEACDIKYVVFFDADDQMDIKDMDTFIPYLKAHPATDVIQGSRFVHGGEALNIPLTRKIILRWAKIVTYIFNGLAITDSHNGYKCFRLEALQRINLTTDTTLYANELIDEYKKLHLSVVELPVHIRYSKYSLKKWQKNMNAVNILLEMLYRKFFFR